MASDRRRLRIERLLDEAEDAVGRYDWDAVRQAAQAVLAFDPENGEALDLLTGAERALGDFALPPTIQPTSSTPAIGPAATPAHPTSFAAGRYQVKRFLGEGGKKRVYLAHDSTLDREVAFALIKTEGLDDTSRTRIQREAQAMGRLGSHPHIVTVFDLGEEQDQPYMVTELMGGGDVEGLIEEADDHRLPLEQAIGIAAETCRGLDFAHGRGIVHRDLKPGNVWLTEDGTAKIGDFGLAVALDRSRLTTEGMMVGTVSYMPPEQAMGGDVTPRSDLYSLGAMLYQMVTGRPPFLGDDSVSIIGQHINTPPVSPTWHNGECPRPLEALIMRLLAKDPSERPESATDVLSALDAIDLTTSVEQPATALDAAQALDSLAGGVFVGRQREMGDLKAALEDALSGRGRLVTLVGEPGIGKTRTAQELATYAGLRGAQVLWGRSYEEQGVPAYWPWVQAIRSYVRERDPEQLRSEMGAGAADIAEVVSDVRERLADLQPAPELEPEQARFRLFDSIAAFLKTASQRQPLVLVLDDLHWADQPSLMLLQFVARELGGARLLLIGTYRDVELSRQHPLAESLGELTRSAGGGFQRVLLRGLTQENVGHFIEMTSGNSAPLGLVEAVHSQTEGNPLFVTEVVRLLVQEGELGADKVRETDSWTIRIPEGVREVIGRRLNRLSQRCNEALTVASIVGREFTLAQLRPLVEEITEDRLFEILEEALAARVIEELPQSVGRYQFTHALIQETLAEELSTTRKVRLHAQIAQALEELYEDDADAHAGELFRHFAEAQTVLGTEKMVRYSILAGEKALASFGWEEAEGYFQRGLVAKGVPLDGTEPAKDAEEATLFFGLGRTRCATSERHRVQEGVDILSRAFDYYETTGDVARAVAVAEHPLPPGRTGRTGPALFVLRALKLVPSDSLQAGRLLSTYGAELGRLENDYEGAQDAFRRALAIARRGNDISMEVRTLASSANLDYFHLRLPEALETAEQAVELARGQDDPQAAWYPHMDAARALWLMGRSGAAQQHLSAALELAERMRDRSRLAGNLATAARLCLRLGNWRQARDFSDQGLAVAPQDSTLQADRALLEYQVGDFDSGEDYLKRYLETIPPAGANIVNPYSFAAQVIPWVARITGELNRLVVAASFGQTVVSYNFATPLYVMYSRAGLGLVAALRGDSTAAAEQYEALKLRRGLLLLNLSTDHVLGLLCHIMGNLDQAVEHFEDALAFCRKAIYRPDLAWTCCDYADMLRERDGEGDLAKAVSLLDESLAISSELGMRPLMERVLSRREILRA